MKDRLIDRKMPDQPIEHVADGFCASQAGEQTRNLRGKLCAFGRLQTRIAGAVSLGHVEPDALDGHTLLDQGEQPVEHLLLTQSVAHGSHPRIDATYAVAQTSIHM